MAFPVLERTEVRVNEFPKMPLLKRFEWIDQPIRARLVEKESEPLKFSLCAVKKPPAKRFASTPPNTANAPSAPGAQIATMPIRITDPPSGGFGFGTTAPSRDSVNPLVRRCSFSIDRTVLGNTGHGNQGQDMNPIVFSGYDNRRTLSGERDEIAMRHRVIFAVGHRNYERSIALDDAVDILARHEAKYVGNRQDFNRIAEPSEHPDHADDRNNVSVYDFGHWTQAPKLRAGEGFFVWSPVATNWVQNFTPLTAK